ncbi:MAG: hypothetical protein FJ265_22205 [Planctomycetes bacterium]|nr:hypothetical protein [Planctomycetota bacterium]
MAWTSFGLMAAMVLVPPWRHGDDLLLSYRPVFASPVGLGRSSLAWDALLEQELVAAVGMLLLLFLRERDERGRWTRERIEWSSAQFD